MPDFFTQLGIEKFSDQIADKVIERGSDKIAAAVVRRIEPILKQSTTAFKKEPDRVVTRQEAAKILKVSQPTLRGFCQRGILPVYGSGTRHMRFLESEVLAALAKS